MERRAVNAGAYRLGHNCFARVFCYVWAGRQYTLCHWSSQPFIAFKKATSPCLPAPPTCIAGGGERPARASGSGLMGRCPAPPAPTSCAAAFRAALPNYSSSQCSIP
ncbi:unnamed protein product [Boreogadus saida]